MTNSEARFAAQVFEADADTGVLSMARRALVDTLGVLIAGMETRSAIAVFEYVRSCGGIEEASLLGRGLKTTARQASFANGVAAHAVDFDDGHRVAAGHPGVVVIPAVLAVAEREGRTLDELLDAIAVGYGAFVAIGRSINPGHVARGFHTTATVGSLAAAAAVSRMLRLSENRTASALSLASLQASGLLEVTQSGAGAKPLQTGRAAETGVLSAELARRGLDGPISWWSGRQGFLRAYGLPDSAQEELILDMSQIHQIYQKYYPSCRHTHSPIDAALALRSETPVDQINSVRVDTYSVARDLCSNQRPVDASEARFSIPFCIATALRYGDCSLQHFTDERIRDSEITELMRNVEVRSTSIFDARLPNQRGAQLTITLRNGSTLVHEQRFPRGEPEEPLTDSDIVQKFIESTAGYCEESDFDSLEFANDIFNASGKRDVAEILERLQSSSRQSSI